MSSLFVTKTTVPSSAGEKHRYWVIRETYWDKVEKRQKQRFIAHLGQDRTIAESKAREICETKGIAFSDLQALDDLKILQDR